MNETKLGRRALHCEFCATAGVEKVFFNQKLFTDHVRDHAGKLVAIRCRKCFSDIVLDSLLAFGIHDRSCGGRVHGSKRPHTDLVFCPTCKTDLTNRSDSFRLSHADGSACRLVLSSAGSSGAAAFVDSGQDERADERARDDDRIPPPAPHAGLDPPSWRNDRFFTSGVFRDLETQSSDSTCDNILVHGMRGLGHNLSDSAFADLFKLLNLTEFKSSFAKGELSKSFSPTVATEKAASLWKETKFRNSVVYLRDLRDVLLDMWKDSALWESLDFDGTQSLDEDDDGLKWSHRWTSFPIYQTRLAAQRARFGPDVDLMSWGLWLDSGETDDKTSIYILVAFPLNAPPSMLRRPDCLFPVGYVYHASDIVDCFEALLPQLEALRDIPRSFYGRKASIVTELNLLAGDNPAITKLLRLMESVKAMIPCKDCMLVNSATRGLFLNDPSRWMAEIRTQVLAEAAIQRMFLDKTVTQKETGESHERIYIYF